MTAWVHARSGRLRTARRRTRYENLLDPQERGLLRPTALLVRDHLLGTTLAGPECVITGSSEGPYLRRVALLLDRTLLFGQPRLPCWGRQHIAAPPPPPPHAGPQDPSTPKGRTPYARRGGSRIAGWRGLFDADLWRGEARGLIPKPERCGLRNGLWRWTVSRPDSAAMFEEDPRKPARASMRWAISAPSMSTPEAETAEFIEHHTERSRRVSSRGCVCTGAETFVRIFAKKTCPRLRQGPVASPAMARAP